MFAVHQSDATLDAMDAWNKGTHGKSGLIDRVKASTVDEAQAEALVIEFLQRYVPKGRSPMCGNSICQDRRFLASTCRELEAFFHYRNLDVSTLKELARRWKPEILAGFKKAQAHTALADIHESIDELAYYRAALAAPVSGALSALRANPNCDRIAGSPRSIRPIRSSPLTSSTLPAARRVARFATPDPARNGWRRCRRFDCSLDRRCPPGAGPDLLPSDFSVVTLA